MQREKLVEFIWNCFTALKLFTFASFGGGGGVVWRGDATEFLKGAWQFVENTSGRVIKTLSYQSASKQSKGYEENGVYSIINTTDNQLSSSLFSAVFETGFWFSSAT